MLLQLPEYWCAVYCNGATPNPGLSEAFPLPSCEAMIMEDDLVATESIIKASLQNLYSF